MTLAPSERDNLTVWRPGKAGFYEVYYLKLNDPAQAFALWVRYTILAPVSRPPVAELWAIAFDGAHGAHAAAKATFPASELRIAEDRFDLRIGEAHLHQSGLTGAIAGGAGGDGPISWELAFAPSSEGLRHFPHASMYRMGVPKTKVLSPNVDVRFSGRVSVNGAVRTLQEVPGMQAHLYGTKHAEGWVWAHANVWEGGQRAWLEGVSARIKLGPFPLPALPLFAFEWRGKRHLFNSLGQLRRNVSVEREPTWTFSCEGDELRLEGEATAPHDRFVGVRYEDPDGSIRFCRNTKIATLVLKVLERDGGGGWRESERLTCRDAAALEFVNGAEHPQVRTRI